MNYSSWKESENIKAGSKTYFNALTRLVTCIDTLKDEKRNRSAKDRIEQAKSLVTHRDSHISEFDSDLNQLIEDVEESSYADTHKNSEKALELASLHSFEKDIPVQCKKSDLPSLDLRPLIPFFLWHKNRIVRSE